MMRIYCIHTITWESYDSNVLTPFNLFRFHSLSSPTQTQSLEKRRKKSIHLEDENSSSASLSWSLIGSPVLLCVSASFLPCGCWTPLYCACVRLERLQLPVWKMISWARRGLPGNQGQQPINTSVSSR